MKLTLGRFVLSFQTFPAQPPAAHRMGRRAGPAAEGELARAVRFRRDEAHLAELEPHLRRDIGLDPRTGDRDVRPHHAELALWAGLHR